MWNIIRAEWKTISLASANFLAIYRISADLVENLSTLIDHRAGCRLRILSPWEDRLAGKIIGSDSLPFNGKPL